MASWRIGARLVGVVVVVVACSSSSDRDRDDGERGLCAEPGPYYVVAERSPDPGTCPLDGVPYEWNDVSFNSSACGTTTVEINGSASSTTGGSCSYSGSVVLTVAAADEVHGRATVEFRNCTAIPERDCTARWDLVYRKGTGDGAATGGTGGTGTSPPEAGAAGEPATDDRSTLGSTCVPVCALPACTSTYVDAGETRLLVRSPVNGCAGACISAVGIDAYCSLSCATDADCENPVRPMRCLTECQSVPESPALGRCWGEDEYQGFTSTTCNMGPPDTSPEESNAEWESRIRATIDTLRSDSGCDEPAPGNSFVNDAALALAELPFDERDRAQELVVAAGVHGPYRYLMSEAGQVSGVEEQLGADVVLPCEPMSVGVSVLGEVGSTRRVAVVLAACVECADGCYAACP